MTAGQQRALERSWPRFGLDYAEGVLIDPAAVFGNDRPTYLEIGFGNGDALAAIAAAHPERNFLGVEVHGPGVGHLLLKLEQADLDNVRVLRQDAMDILRQGLPACCLDGVYLFFPDPWPKKRHHKRRIVQPEFIALLARVIRPGGFLHMATDWEDYARHMLATLQAAAEFQNKDAGGAFVIRPADRPLTRFEQRGQRLGHGVRDLVFMRR
jgi:tRNA (guanine-N7-)-methyltransferase